ncbi:MAG TPA: ribosome-associated translation inhibitor RaiA [Vicinamibacteria bacterium]|nr:ribosome-associated translation inhibitor RaiA [Vicinamibacteria bacterium]
MKIQITGRHIETPESLKTFVRSRVGKLEKYIDGITDVHVTLSAEKYRQIAEINVHSRGKLYLSAKEASDDLKTSVQQSLEKIVGQAKKKQEKRIDRKRRAPKTAEAEGTYNLIAADGGPPTGTRIIESRRFLIKPLSVEEAVLAIEEQGGEFLVFRNAANDRTNVLYRRPDGNFGLIDPER